MYSALSELQRRSYGSRGDALRFARRLPLATVFRAVGADADDLKIYFLELELRSAHLGVRAELSPPEIIADDNHARVAGSAFFNRTRSAERGRDTQQREEVGRNLCPRLRRS